ncbi:MAG: hypothetical protein LC792_27510, partial [Actinobacteria bacterium]|nr:hypothetical protein [Actinomycetota bacterium]
MSGLVIGLVVGWMSAPGGKASTTTYEATTTLLLDPQARTTSLIEEAMLRATKGTVPDRVASRLRLDPRLVRSMLSARITGNRGLLLITGHSTDARQAEALANVTAEELIVEVGGPKSPLRTLEPAAALPAKSDSVRGPTSHADRALLLAAFGLVLGVGAGFGLDRFDSRIRSKATVEDALGVPVLSEVPQIAGIPSGQLLTGAEYSSFAEAYRRLRAGIIWWAAQTDKADGGQVIVVASAIGGDGTTTTVAHLAAVLGEIGRSALAVSADLRHPRLHLYFDKAREPGLTDVLRGAPDARRLVDLNLATTVRGVR